eukprot:gene29330-18129_t
MDAYDEKLRSLDINPRIVNSLAKAQIRDVVSLLQLSSPELVRRSQLTLGDVQAARATAAASVTPSVSLTVHRLLTDPSLRTARLSLGCP